MPLPLLISDEQCAGPLTRVSKLTPTRGCWDGWLRQANGVRLSVVAARRRCCIAGFCEGYHDEVGSTDAPRPAAAGAPAASPSLGLSTPSDLAFIPRPPLGSFNIGSGMGRELAALHAAGSPSSVAWRVADGCRIFPTAS